MNSNKSKQKKGQILVITLLVLTILSVLTVSLVILNNRDVRQSVNSEVYEKIYNATETKLKEILGVVADPNSNLNSLTSTYPQCLNLGGANTLHDCNFEVASDADPTVIYAEKIEVSNEKDIEDYTLNKDRPLAINLVGYAAPINISINKVAALDFTLIYLQGSVYKSVSGVYDPASGTYSSTDPTFSGYFSLPNPSNPLSFKLTFPAAFNAFRMLSITPRLKTVGDSLLISVTAEDRATFPAQIRKFVATAFTKGDNDSPVVKIVTQIPLTSQSDGLLDYSLITPDSVDIRE